MADNKEPRKDKKQWWRRPANLLAATTGVAVAGLAAQRLRRPRDLRWLDHTHVLHHAMHSSFRVVEGVRLHYQEKVKDTQNKTLAETIILLHGFCSSNYTWKDCMEPLAAEGYRVIAPDLKGFGFSEKPADNRYEVRDQANLIINLMNSLGIEQATLVGNSYGGAVSMACALNHPNRVKKLVLVDAVHNSRSLSHRPLYARLLQMRGMAEILGPLLFGSPFVIRNYMNKMYYDQSVVTTERYLAYHRPLRTSACQTAAITTTRQWKLDWIQEQLHLIKAPTLIIWGEHDTALPVQWGAEIHLAIPESEFVVIPSCGHLPQEERALETCELIIDFCAQVSQPLAVNG
jgi:pimeloyl-ACP methyl ester carboxylesterase